MGKYEIYCDESRPETIYGDNSADKFMVIGGIMISSEERKKIKNKLDYLKNKHKIPTEFKWNKVSPSKLEFYREIIEYFFQNKNIRFRCIVVDTDAVDLDRYHDSDSELGFYKFYYQVLSKWCDWNDSYRIYLDHKQNKLGNRLEVMKEVLNNGSFATIESVLAFDSSESVFIQLADLLIGAVSYTFNEYDTKENASSAKKEIIELIEENLFHPIEPTSSSEKKFNVFKIRLR